MHHRTEDIVFKNIFELLKNDGLKFFGVEDEIVDTAGTETNLIHTVTNFNDNVYRSNKNRLIHLEFQSTSSRKDLQRFMRADAVLCYNEGMPVRTIVIYTSDIANVETALDLGSIKYQVEAFYMSTYDGDKIYAEVKSKIDRNETLSKQDLVGIVLTPLMNNSVDRATRIEQLLEVSEVIVEKDEQTQIQCMLYMFAEKFIGDSNRLKQIKERFRMTTLGKMLIEDAVADAVEDVAKNLLKKFFDPQVVAETTGLDIEQVEKLKEELNNSRK